MNKTKLAAHVAEQTGLSKADAAKAVDCMLDAITESLANGEKVTLSDFGTFEVSERAERTGRNPQTGDPMTIAAAKVPKFKPLKKLKDVVNGDP